MNNYTINNNKTYSRYNNNETNILLDQLKKYYNCNNVCIVNSGQHANYISLNLLINNISDCNLIYCEEAYYETKQIIDFIKEKNNINLYTIDIFDDENIINKFNNELKNKNNILFLESCTNPFGYIFNFDIIPQLRILSKNLYVICDNSWLSNFIFNPFNYDIDIITISLTKYYANNKCILGACLIKSDEIYKNFDLYLRISGIHNSIYNLNIINKNMDFIYERINTTSNLCKQVLNYLNKNNIIIYHPCLEMHKSYIFTIKYFKNNLYPSTFLIGFYCYISNLSELLNDLKIFKIEVSFGSNNTKIDPHIFYKNNITYLRISLGYDDCLSNIILGLDELIDKITLNSLNLV